MIWPPRLGGSHSCVVVETSKNSKFESQWRVATWPPWSKIRIINLNIEYTVAKFSFFKKDSVYIKDIVQRDGYGSGINR
jgi:hypothetical protein